MEASKKEREGEKGLWGKIWEKLWWLFALVLIGSVAWVYKAYGGVVLLKLWAAAFSCLGAAMTAYGWRARKLAAGSSSWFPTQALVLHSEVVKEENSSFSRDGINPSYETVSYYPNVEYEYEAQGEKLRSNKVLLVNVNYSAAEANATVAKYPKGATVNAWYDPRNPKRVVLEPGLRGSESKYRIPLLAGLAFILFGISTLALLKFLRL
jgi:hypothetical protein